MRRTVKVISAMVLIASAASAAQAGSDDYVNPLHPELVRSIPLRNNSGTDLYFFLSDKEGWRTLFLKSGSEADLPLNEPVVAVPTTDDAVVETTAPTTLPEEIIITFFVYRKPYFFRQLTPDKRWELCWSQKLDCWLVQRLGEGLCP